MNTFNPDASLVDDPSLTASPSASACIECGDTWEPDTEGNVDYGLTQVAEVKDDLFQRYVVSQGSPQRYQATALICMGCIKEGALAQAAADYQEHRLGKVRELLMKYCVPRIEYDGWTTMMIARTILEGLDAVEGA